MDLPPGTKVFEIPLSSVAVTDSNAAAFLVSWLPVLLLLLLLVVLLCGGPELPEDHMLAWFVLWPSAACCLLSQAFW
jgi:hypothetical protein